MPAASHARAGVLKPGMLIVRQPDWPVPLLLQFPYPAWATRGSEVRATDAGPFKGC